jgi:acetyl-CoA C-acetyltransferase
VVIKAALQRAGLKGEQVDEVVFGCVLQAHRTECCTTSHDPRWFTSGITAFTVNKVCVQVNVRSSGCQIIKAGDADIIVGRWHGKHEQRPFALNQARYGYRMGKGELIDCMIKEACGRHLTIIIWV